MIEQRNYGEHSAHVEMSLLINGDSISITQMGPDFLLIEPATPHPPCEGLIRMQVDESHSEWRVRLPEGIPAQANRVPVVPCG